MQNKKFDTVLGVFRLFYKYQPVYYAYLIPVILLSSILPLVSVWLPKIIIEYLTEDKRYEEILMMIGLYISILAAVNVIKNILTNKMNICLSKFTFRLQMEVGKAAMNADMKEIENAVYKEEIIMAGNISNISSIMTILQNLISAIVTIVGLAYIIVRMNVLFFLLVGFTLSIKIILSVFRFKYTMKLRLEEAENYKSGGYLDFLQYYSEGAAKELRVNHAQNWLFAKITSFREQMLNIQFRAFNQYRLFEIFLLLAVAVQNLCILIALSRYYVSGRISIADFSLYFSAITLLSSTLSGITDQLVSFSQRLLNCSDYHKVVKMDYDSDKEEKYENTDSNRKSVTRIKFENVSFAYPGTEIKVLENVSFELNRGDRVMLAGKNGSGKTTIIKLLCRFYEPDSGKIWIDDTDISTIPIDEYYSLIAAVFQDFSLFSFKINENISMKSEEKSDSERLQKCLEKVELDSLVKGLKEKENTYITKLFSEYGVEFSGGEQQKLGLARALYKNAPILVLDEPTANLDVKMEDELYKRFYDMTRNKISLTVSHRLSQAAACNKIYVLERGVICERGTHSELMQKNGIYAEMFKKQQEAYVMEKGMDN